MRLTETVHGHPVDSGLLPSIAEGGSAMGSSPKSVGKIEGARRGRDVLVAGMRLTETVHFHLTSRPLPWSRPEGAWSPSCYGDHQTRARHATILCTGRGLCQIPTDGSARTSPLRRSTEVVVQTYASYVHQNQERRLENHHSSDLNSLKLWRRAYGPAAHPSGRPSRLFDFYVRQ